MYEFAKARVVTRGFVVRRPARKVCFFHRRSAPSNLAAGAVKQHRCWFDGQRTVRQPTRVPSKGTSLRSLQSGGFRVGLFHHGTQTTSQCVAHQRLTLLVVGLNWLWSWHRCFAASFPSFVVLLAAIELPLSSTQTDHDGGKSQSALVSRGAPPHRLMQPIKNGNWKKSLQLFQWGLHLWTEEGGVGFGGRSPLQIEGWDKAKLLAFLTDFPFVTDTGFRDYICSQTCHLP